MLFLKTSPDMRTEIQKEKEKLRINVQRLQQVTEDLVECMISPLDVKKRHELHRIRRISPHA